MDNLQIETVRIYVFTGTTGYVTLRESIRAHLAAKTPAQALPTGMSAVKVGLKVAGNTLVHDIYTQDDITLASTDALRVYEGINILDTLRVKNAVAITCEVTFVKP